MSCEKYTEKIPLYILDELSSEEKTELQKHLENCINCQKELTEYHDLIGALSSEDESSISEKKISEVKNRVYKSVLQAAVQPKPTFTVFKYALQAAAAIVIFFAGYFTSAYYSETFQTDHRFTSIQSESELTQSFQSYKHSKLGFKLIAKGKNALESGE